MSVPAQQDRISYKSVPMVNRGGGGMLMPQTFGDAVAFSEIMARSQHAIPKHLRDVPGACLAVTMQALRWEMDPFAVASKSYNVKDIIAYEAQLIAAVVHTRAPIKTRPDYAYSGEGQERRCTVSAMFDDGVKRSYESPKLGEILVKNSPLWKADPDQQLGYYSIRAFARRYCPEVILGVYTPEEAETFRGPDNARDVTPRTSLAERLQGPTGSGFSEQHVISEIGGDKSLTAKGDAHEVATQGASLHANPPAGETSGQAGAAPATELVSEDASQDTPSERPAAGVSPSPPEAAGRELQGSSDPGSDGVVDGEAVSKPPSESSPPSLPEGTLILYAAALRRAQKKDSLAKYAKQFWDERGGWESWKATPDGEIAGQIYNIFRDHFGDRNAIERELREII